MESGGWNFDVLKGCNLPQQVATGFSEVFGHLVGANYEPVLYCGTQVVHGTNHMLICKMKLSDQDATEKLAKVVLNQQPNPEKITGDWSIVSIAEL